MSAPTSPPHHLGLSGRAAVFAAGRGAAGSVYFGKSVLETRGLAWTIAAHMLFDIAILTAFYGEF
jgi:hypothetical protein